MGNMENTSKVLYEYYLKEGEVRQKECMIISEKQYSGGKIIYQYTRDSLYGSRFVSNEQMGAVHNNHIYAFDDDIAKYTEVFIEYVENNIKTLQHQLNRNKKVLKTLQKTGVALEKKQND